MLSDREKSIVGFLSVMRIMSDVEQNPKFSIRYKATLRARMMTELQQHFFARINPDDMQTVFEEVPGTFNAMKEHLTRMIFSDVKSQAGFGTDKPLGTADMDLRTQAHDVAVSGGGGGEDNPNPNFPSGGGGAGKPVEDDKK